MARSKKIADVLATIDPVMEHAASAAAVDHESQASSWIAPEVAEEIRETNELEAIADLETGVAPRGGFTPRRGG